MENQLGRDFKRGKKDISQEMDIDVEMFEWAEAGKDKVIGTSGLGPCVGLILYDGKLKHSFVGHFTNPAMGEPDEMLRTIKEKYPDASKLKAFLGGGQPFSPDEIQELGLGPDNNGYYRQAIIDKLNEVGIPQKNIFVNWSSSPEDNMTMSIENKTGKVVYENLTLPNTLSGIKTISVIYSRDVGIKR